MHNYPEKKKKSLYLKKKSEETLNCQLQTPRKRKETVQGEHTNKEGEGGGSTSLKTTRRSARNERGSGVIKDAHFGTTYRRKKEKVGEEQSPHTYSLNTNQNKKKRRPLSSS